MLPKSFKVFDRVIAVKQKEDLTPNSGLLGLANFDANCIQIQTVLPEICDEQSQKETFYHEMVHILLDSIEETKLSKDEKFVGLFSRVLKQAIESMEN